MDLRSYPVVGRGSLGNVSALPEAMSPKGPCFFTTLSMSSASPLPVSSVQPACSL